MSLDSLIARASDLKFIFVGGKGGVGKTTTSSAVASLLATHCAKRVLLISTDPAHSLGDAWRTKFTNVPKKVELANASDAEKGGGSLEVMEVDPQESMQGELHVWAEMSQELFENSNTSNDNGKCGNDKADEWMSRIRQFQEWLSGIPGIDEATALSTAIGHIESGRYDLIVFDTAPTGHTLKLLALPEILEQGIDKLQSWQTTFWGYWQALKAASGGSLSKAQKRANLQQLVTEKLIKYKHDIQKVAFMLQDQQRTRFVAVCLAEYLSVSETQRLLQELKKHKVIASHIVVNQLVVQDALTSQQLSELEALAEVGNLQLPVELLRKTVHACRLTTARKSIQQKYLQDLKEYPETQSILDGICEVPLLAEEVTGPEAIHRFSKLLIRNDPGVPFQVNADGAAVAPGKGKLYDDLIAAKTKRKEDSSNNTVSFAPGDIVQVTGLAKSPEFNELEGKVTTHMNSETGRYGVSISYQGKTKTLALHPKNIALVRKSDKKSKANGSVPQNGNDSQTDTPSLGGGLMDKAKTILQDPEIKDLVEANPRFQAAVQDCLDNPMNVMKYLGDPELSPLISKALAKM